MLFLYHVAECIDSPIFFCFAFVRDRFVSISMVFLNKHLLSNVDVSVFPRACVHAHVRVCMCVAASLAGWLMILCLFFSFLFFSFLFELHG